MNSNHALTPNSESRRYSLIAKTRDDLLLTGEVLSRQIYWRSPRLRNALQKLLARKKKPIQFIPRQALKDLLREIGVAEGALVMVHTSVTNFRLIEPDEDFSRTGFMSTANNLVGDLLELVGSTGTLVMPTNPCYQTEDFLRPAQERQKTILHYDSQTTPCEVGLANELFRRRHGVLRSLHPYNTLAAHGPLASSLLENNLNESEPLPHGVHSGYYRLCRQNALIVGIGASLRKYMTLVHVPEDVRDAEWPIEDFFERRRYLIRIEGRDELHTVRQRRAEFGLFCTLRRVFLDLVREGILHRKMVGDVPIDWAFAQEVFDYIMEKNRKTHYPYDGITFVQPREKSNDGC
jgi:aminoglycoside 3-N-acetyltransferase